MPFKWVLPLTPQGGSIGKLGWEPASTPDEITMFEIDARPGFDKPVRITSTTIARGLKGLQQQVQFSALAPGQLMNALRQQMIGSTWQSIDDVQWRYDEKAAASILMITGLGTVDWDDDGGRAKSYAMPGGGFSPPEKRLRSAEQNQNLPFYNKPEFSCDVTTVRLPAQTQARQWTSKPGYDTVLFGRHYYRAFDLRDVPSAWYDRLG